MNVVRKRRPAEVLAGFFLLCHPIPVFFHTLAVALFALMAAWSAPTSVWVWSVIGLVVAAHMAMQLAIAVLNDYCDRRLDAVGKPEKPIPRGLVRPHEALLLGIFLIAVMLLLLLPLSPLALLISLLYLALGLSYNLGLKGTPLSGILFALAIPLIPVYAFVGVGHIIPFVYWVIPVAALLGVALNLANSLPDSEEDGAQGARTLAVVFGLRFSWLLCSLLVLLATLLIAVYTITRLVSALIWVMVPTVLIACLLVGVMFLFFGPAMGVRRRKGYFYLVVCTCLVLAVGWLAGALLSG